MQYGDSMNENFGKLKLSPRPSPTKLSKDDVKSKPQTIMQVCYKIVVREVLNNFNFNFKVEGTIVYL